MDYLQFKIDGEFICRLARTWFWDENRPYEKCEELLLDCLNTDEKIGRASCRERV